MEPMLRFKADDGSDFPDWEEEMLGELVEIQRGGSPRPISKFITTGEGINWIKIGDAPSHGNCITKVKERIIPEGKAKSREVHKGDLLLSNSMSFGRPYILGVDGCIHDGWLVVHDTNAVFETEFLCEYLGTESIFRQYRRLAAGSAVNNLNKDLVASVVLGVPSLPEQRKIADLLSAVDDVIAAQEAEVAAWEKRKKGVMQKLFSQEVRFKADDGSEFPEWEERRIDSFANCYAGATPSTKVAEYWQNGSIPWMSSGEVNNREIYETEKKISELGYEKSSTKMIKPNTVVIALAGQGKTRGMVAIARISVCTNQSLCAIETNDMVNDDYLYQYLITQYDNLRRISSGDGTRGGLNLQLVGEYKVFLPVLHEQQKIADCLSSLDDVINQIQAELSAWKEFKKGLLQQMFV